MRRLPPLTTVRRFALVATVLVALLASAEPSAGSATAPRTWRMLGVSLQGVPRDPTLLDAYNRRVRRPARIVNWFRSWQSQFAWPVELDAVAARSATPMITWEPWVEGDPSPLRAIARGVHDEYIRSSARIATNWGRPILVRLAHEMNGTWYPWGALKNDNRPADYIAAWRRVVRLFRAEGARNVRWVWSPNVEYGLPPARRFFPGDRWVDWVALDGFNWGPALPSGWRSIRETFEQSYRNMVRLSRKPIMIAETATASRGGNRARWISAGFLRDIPRHMPRIRAVIWFNWRAQLDWRFDTSPTALHAYQRVAASRGWSRPRRR